MPFDGTIGDVRIARLEVLCALASKRQKRRQGSFQSCLWWEATWDRRLRDLGMESLLKFQIGSPYADVVLPAIICPGFVNFEAACAFFGISDDVGRFAFGVAPKTAKAELLLDALETLKAEVGHAV